MKIPKIVNPKAIKEMQIKLFEQLNGRKMTDEELKELDKDMTKASKMYGRHRKNLSKAKNKKQMGSALESVFADIIENVRDATRESFGFDDEEDDTEKED